MALENDFLVFAGASGSNVLTQAAYAAAAATATGYVTGTASSAAVNKTLRQTSIISAMIAQFICDNAAQPAIDDGTTATLETNFEAAILAVAETINIPISQVTGLAAELAGFLPLNGNAVSASVLDTARNIALTGAVTGAVNFNGSSNVSITTTFGNIAASTLLGNPTGAAAVPRAITLANGLVFSGSALGMGAITPTSVSASTGNANSAGSFTTSGSQSTLNLTDEGSQGCGIRFNASGGNKGIRVLSNELQVTNSADTSIIFVMDDSGNLSDINSLSLLGATSMSMSEGLINAVTLVASTEVVTPVIDAPSTTLVFGTTGAGTLILRPNGASSTTNQGTYASTGNLTIAGTLSQGSDVTVKTNIVKLKNCLDFVENYLVGVEYDRTDKVSHDRGFISQEVEKGESGLIEHVENGDNKKFKNLKYIETIPYLANAITELRAIVRAQAAEIAGLKGTRPAA